MKKPETKTPSKPDLTRMGDIIHSELSDRKRHPDRHDRESLWEEVDRQVNQIPPEEHREVGQEWIPEFELPWQSYALEVLAADADRIQFPDSPEWFSAKAEMTDEYLDRVDRDLVMPDAVDRERKYLQEDIDAITGAALIHTHKQYDFRGAIATLQAEAFKYGTYVCRVRQVKRNTFTNDYRGVVATEDFLPVVTPMSIKHTYLDDKCEKALGQGTMIGPLQIYEYEQNVEDVRLAAKYAKGKGMEGGWINAAVAKLEAEDENGRLSLYEAEGDIIVTRSQENQFYPNMIVTVAMGTEGPVVVRVRENQFPFHSMLHGTYFSEGISVYGSSPLMKGYPIQLAAQQLYSHMVETSALNARPPVQWNSNDTRFRATGGPVIAPGALWDSFTDVNVHQIGELEQTRGVFEMAIKQYEEVTGVSAVRTGASTKSHQTATAIQHEDQRGQNRTVSFVRKMSRGLLTNILNMELYILRKSMKRQDIFVPDYQAYVEMSNKSLPDAATMNVLGAAGPVDKQQRAENKLAALNAIVGLQELADQTGGKRIDIDKVRQAILAEGWPEADLQEFLVVEEPQNGVPMQEEGQQMLQQQQQQLGGVSPLPPEVLPTDFGI